jgi:acyl dehydratase
MSEISEFLGAARAEIGRVLARQQGEACAREFQRWAAAVGELNPLYLDRDFARRHGHPDVVCPPLFLSKVTNGVSYLADLRADGLDRRNELDVPMPPRRMAGGEDYVFGAVLYPGDQIAMTRTLTDVEHKQGRSGEFLVFTIEETYVKSDGTPAGRMRRRVIAR